MNSKSKFAAGVSKLTKQGSGSSAANRENEIKPVSKKRLRKEITGGLPEEISQKHHPKVFLDGKAVLSSKQKESRAPFGLIENTNQQSFQTKENPGKQNPDSSCKDKTLTAATKMIDGSQSLKKTAYSSAGSKLQPKKQSLRSTPTHSKVKPTTAAAQPSPVDLLNRTMILPERSQALDLPQKNDDQQSQRSASCDGRRSLSLAPFSANESGVIGPCGALEVDSAQASFADWVDVLKASHSFGDDPDFRFVKEVELLEPVQLDEEEVHAYDLSEIKPIEGEDDADDLNKAFIHEHSAFDVNIGRVFASKGAQECYEVKDRLESLCVQKSFNITEMIERDAQPPGRRTDFPGKRVTQTPFKLTSSSSYQQPKH